MHESAISCHHFSIHDTFLYLLHYTDTYCRSCGRVVCAVCAPAGDNIPADGIGKYQKLPDHRMTLPFMGLADKQRVCTPCFLHSYDRITAVDDAATAGTSISLVITSDTDMGAGANSRLKDRSGSITL